MLVGVNKQQSSELQLNTWQLHVIYDIILVWWAVVHHKQHIRQHSTDQERRPEAANCTGSLSVLYCVHGGHGKRASSSGAATNIPKRPQQATSHAQSCSIYTDNT